MNRLRCYLHACLLAILESIGGMYPASLDLHTACPLYQCLSLEDLNRYLLCGTQTRGAGLPAGGIKMPLTARNHWEVYLCNVRVRSF